MPVLEIPLPRTIRQLIVPVSFQVHFLHVYSPWAYDAVVCKKLMKPHAEGHSKWSQRKASLWEQAWLASRGDCGTCRPWMLVPRVMQQGLGTCVFLKMSHESKWKKRRIYGSLSVRLQKSSCGQRSGESALGNWRKKYVEKSWWAWFTCTALHEATFKEWSLSNSKLKVCAT